ncbi:uncharacterized protein LOC6544616 [Drosophila erecta]|uniref:Uncharacterized protein n=1 Tax=Drosophila erecta TaxID=7220 RepID=B3NH19_DROER|nr:uncharacterized protein LOC6544616 [Drosophila erecta]EDV51476.1 uncharacterized protein Dere_GG15536 [Drosophila erecta]
MEDINFNDFTPKERYEIIKEFLVKMRNAKSMPSKDLHVQRFFEHYLRKFYKMPEKLVNDIAYCQRAIKTHLEIHQTIVSVFAQQADADPIIKDKYINELEEMLYELNAECNYLVLRLQDDIDRFCSAFTEQDVKPDKMVINDIVSAAIVPLIVNPDIALKPCFVMERPNEGQLIMKYFIIDGVEPIVENPHTVESPNPLSPSHSNLDMRKSRLNLQAALSRARANCKPAKKSKDDENKLTKDSILHAVGLCSHAEYKRLKLSMVLLQKRKPRSTEKTK